MPSSSSSSKPERVCIVGSGNWGSAISKIAGRNILAHPDKFDRKLPMWVFEEELEDGGGKLTEVINEKHENVKYLPGIPLPENVVAIPDLVESIKGATYLIFVLPHQFLGKTIEQLKGHVEPGTKGLTLIKGVDVSNDQISIYADVIQKELGISCSSLSGANIANEVAQEKFSETTIGYRNQEEGEMWKLLLDSEKFKVSLIEDVAGVSLCGALKNIVAVGAGFIDGLEWGDNAKAAVMRNGLVEMKNFGLEFFKDVKAATFLEESAGVADLMTSCMGGRNRKVAEAFARTGKSFDELEKELLGGQKLQGAATAKEINSFLKSKNRVDAYPLFKAVYEIAYEGRDVKTIVTGVSKSKL